MTPFAAQADVEARLRRDLTSDEASYIDEMLEEASVLVSEHCGRDFDPVPDAVRLATSRIVARALIAPSGNEGTQAFTGQAGPYQQIRTLTRDASSGNVYLNSVDRRYLRRWSKARVISLDTR